jgi:hypothetical protein
MLLANNHVHVILWHLYTEMAMGFMISMLRHVSHAALSPHYPKTARNPDSSTRRFFDPFSPLRAPLTQMPSPEAQLTRRMDVGASDMHSHAEHGNERDGSHRQMDT